MSNFRLGGVELHAIDATCSARVPFTQAFSIDDAFPPKYTKLEMIMNDGTRLAYCDPRRFGRIKLRGAEPAELAALAPDALEAPAVAAMRSALSSKSAPIKAVLLDQSAAVWKSTSMSGALHYEQPFLDATDLAFQSAFEASPGQMRDQRSA